MKKYFIVSLCKNGILGGGLLADDTALHYRTGKVTVSPEIRHIVMPYEDIRSVSTGWLICFPTVSLSMKDGKNYRFIVFARKKLLSLLSGKIPESFPEGKQT